MRALAAALLTVGLVAAFAPRQVWTRGLAAEDVGPPESGARIELYRPEGPGPFPAVVVLHPCNGIGRSTRRWARRLRDWGYLAAVPDSFGPRGTANVCGHGIDVPASARAEDAFATAAILAARPDVRRDRMAVMGMSHGAGGVLAAAAEGPGSPPFAAAVALYPWCPSRTVRLRTETLVLVGDADDWTPAPRCIAFAAREAAQAQPLTLKVYPGALHAFDNGAPVSTYFGHRVGGDPDAAADAVPRIRDFLAGRLR